MLKAISEYIETAKSYSSKELESIKYMLFFAIVLDLGFIYWYLELKKLSVALIMVIAMLLAGVLILERQKGGGKMEDNAEKLIEEVKKEDQESENKEEEKDDEKSGVFDNLGLPDAKEYEERLKKAIT